MTIGEDRNKDRFKNWQLCGFWKLPQTQRCKQVYNDLAPSNRASSTLYSRKTPQSFSGDPVIYFVEVDETSVEVLAYCQELSKIWWRMKIWSVLLRPGRKPHWVSSSLDSIISNVLVFFQNAMPPNAHESAVALFYARLWAFQVRFQITTCSLLCLHSLTARKISASVMVSSYHERASCVSDGVRVAGSKDLWLFHLPRMLLSLLSKTPFWPLVDERSFFTKKRSGLPVMAIYLMPEILERLHFGHFCYAGCEFSRLVLPQTQVRFGCVLKSDFVVYFLFSNWGIFLKYVQTDSRVTRRKNESEARIPDEDSKSRGHAPQNDKDAIFVLRKVKRWGLLHQKNWVLNERTCRIFAPNIPISPRKL